MRNTTNITVNILDFNPIFEKLKGDYIKQFPYYKEKEFSFFLPEIWGFVETEKGKIMICNEGVVDSHPISEKDPFQAALYIEEKKPTEQFSLFPIGMLQVKDVKEIEELPVIEKQPLETFIRSFGTRLETNFQLCKRFLEPIVRP